MDRRAWAQANPGLGIRITEDAIEREREAMDDETFARERRSKDANHDVMLVGPWLDPTVERVGYEPTSEYVEVFWLPVLGPSATWLYRRLGTFAADVDAPRPVNLDLLAHSVGLARVSQRGGLDNALTRLTMFGFARWGSSGRVFEVRRKAAPVPAKLLCRLPVDLRTRHTHLRAVQAVADAVASA
jgi:hypothetical protein